ncbi:MAG: hypothetical protein IKF65_08860, partial [Clostridia bacterium]|nr:hypothetical protein [Clostridia bacterium]
MQHSGKIHRMHDAFDIRQANLKGCVSAAVNIQFPSEGRRNQSFAVKAHDLNVSGFLCARIFTYCIVRTVVPNRDLLYIPDEKSRIIDDNDRMLCGQIEIVNSLAGRKHESV